jgi:hypothetical protein
MKVRQNLRNRLDRLVSLYETASRIGEPSWRLEKRPGVTSEGIEGTETRLGSLLPPEARELYSWHNGCVPWLAPDLGFKPIEVACARYLARRGQRLIPVTNDSAEISLHALFPILDIDKVTLNLPLISRGIGRLVPLFMLDLENNQATVVSRSVRGLIDHLIREFESGNVEYTAEGLTWKRSPYQFPVDMRPFGQGTPPPT